MLAIVAFGLLFFGVTVWPAVAELKFIVSVLWGECQPAGGLHLFLTNVIEALQTVKNQYPFLLYGYDWLAFAHICLAILFAGAIRDPVRNKWIVQSGLIMCALVPVLAAVCIPIRGIPLGWFFVDLAFAPGAALPLWIALQNIRKIEQNGRFNVPANKGRSQSI